MARSAADILQEISNRLETAEQARLVERAEDTRFRMEERERANRQRLIDRADQLSEKLKNNLTSQLTGILGLKSATPFGFIGQMNQMVQDRRQIVAAIDKQSLAFSRDMTVLKENTDVAAGAEQFGPQIALKTAIDSLKTGTYRLSKDSFNLAMQMRAVGESSEALFQLQRQSQVMGGTSVAQMDTLAKALERARTEYGISTEYLVDAMSKLSSRFTDFSLMGITADVNQAMIGLVQKFGTGTADLFNKAIDVVTKGGNIAKFARFGISGEVATFLEKPTAEGLEAIADKAGAFFEEQIAGFSALNKAEAVALAKQLYGEEGAVFAAIARLTPQEMTDPKVAADALKRQNDIQKDIADSLRGLNDNIAKVVNSVDSSFRIGLQVVGLITSVIITLNAIKIAQAAMAAANAAGGVASVGLLGSLGPIALGVIALGAAIWGLYEIFSDDKDQVKTVKIDAPKAGGQFITNEYMAANAELTRGILSSVFASQQMFLLAEAKKQTALQTQAAQAATQTARATRTLATAPVSPPTPAIGGP
jgi:hypothetical protein